LRWRIFVAGLREVGAGYVPVGGELHISSFFNQCDSESLMTGLNAIGPPRPANARRFQIGATSKYSGNKTLTNDV
jgi:hypothetical protein